MEIGLDKVKYIGLTLGFAGFLVLLFLTPDYTTIRPSEAKKELLGEKVSITGEVKNLFMRNGNVFFDLENNGTIKGVFFRPSIEHTSLLRNKALVQVKGTLSVYRDEMEVIVEKVKQLD